MSTVFTGKHHGLVDSLTALNRKYSVDAICFECSRNIAILFVVILLF